MEKLSVEKLQEIIESHGKWWRNEEGGSRADLRGANLCGANLCRADLRCADLCDADLRGANLCVANLCGADLRDTNLCGADLRGANLRDAKLRGADLRDADLRGADLCGANLCGADLRCANLSKQIIQVGPIGSRKSQTIYNVTDDVVQCGCWNNFKGGSLADFEDRVRSEYTDNNKHFIEYMNAIAYFKLLRGV